MKIEKHEGSRKFNRYLKSVAVAVVGMVIMTVGYFTIAAPHHDPNDYDVVVVGAGPGGIAASIQAARMGEKVALLEETDWVGGQMTAAGVGTMDEGDSVVRKFGLYKEFIDQVTSYYKSHDKSLNTCYYGENNICVDPAIGRRILQNMLGKEEKNLTLLTETQVTNVTKSGDTVTGVTTNKGHLTSRVVVDASEYGDVLDKAGADYRIGNGTCTEPNEKACIQSISYVGVMKKYPEGVPKPLIFTKAPPGYTEKVKKHFEQFITANGNDHVENPKYPLSFQSYLAFRGFPDSSNPKNYDGYQHNGQLITRSALIAGNDYPTEGVLSSKFLTDAHYRQEATCKAKLLTVQLVYYIQHDLGQTEWSLANDEGYDTPYNSQHDCVNLKGFESFEHQLATEPYIRESKRIIGADTLTGNNLQYSWKDREKIPHFNDSIAVGYYPMDLHNCKTPTTLEPQFDSESNWSVRFAGGPFEVPMGVLIPQRLNGLLAAEKNISSSRLANGAIREQPIAMDIGQAVGVLAAEASRQHKQPRQVAASDVQAILRQSNLKLAI